MENPNTRPYTAEELEALLKEETPYSDMPQNNNGGQINTSPVILHYNNPVFTEIAPVEALSLNIEVSADKPQTPSKLKTHAPFIILGIILTGVVIYLYYDYRKRKVDEKIPKPKNE